VRDGVVTSFGLELLRRGMPEVEPSCFHPGLSAAAVTGLITGETLVRIIQRLLEVREQFPRECPECHEQSEESDTMPELLCPKCGNTQPLPSGDEVLLRDLILLAEGLQSA